MEWDGRCSCPYNHTTYLPLSSEIIIGAMNQFTFSSNHSHNLSLSIGITIEINIVYLSNWEKVINLSWIYYYRSIWRKYQYDWWWKQRYLKYLRISLIWSSIWRDVHIYFIDMIDEPIGCSECLRTPVCIQHIDCLNNLFSYYTIVSVSPSNLVVQRILWIV